MSKVVFLGGFGNGYSSAERAGNALGKYYDYVEAFTFSQYINFPEEIQKAMPGRDLVAFSASALALQDVETAPDYAYLLNPPIPTTVGKLVTRAAIKTTRMHVPGMGIRSVRDVPAVARYSASAIADIAAHPVANFRNLNHIAEFDTFRVTKNARNRGVESMIAWTSNDAFFMPEAVEHAKANPYSVPVHYILGEHDEVILRPDQYFESLFAATPINR